MKLKKLLGDFLPAPLRRFWVVSDLQQKDPGLATLCMTTAVDDFTSLRTPVDAVFYLGDSTEGTVLEHLQAMAEMQVEQFARVDAPVYYVMGNHEFDYHRWAEGASGLTIPMRETILRHPQWHTTASPLDWTLEADFGDFFVFLLSDRCDPDDPTWVTSHCGLRDVANARPTDHDFAPDIAAVRARLQALGKPTFTMSHYAFPGGNRDGEGPLQQALLPLPSHVLAHFYGHSHIGDAHWGGKNVFRQVSTVNDSAISQFDVASLEHIRGSAVRSAIVEWYGGQDFGVFFRNHSASKWEKIHVETPPPGGQVAWHPQPR